MYIPYWKLSIAEYNICLHASVCKQDFSSPPINQRGGLTCRQTQTTIHSHISPALPNLLPRKRQSTNYDTQTHQKSTTLPARPTDTATDTDQSVVAAARYRSQTITRVIRTLTQPKCALRIYYILPHVHEDKGLSDKGGGGLDYWHSFTCSVPFRVVWMSMVGDTCIAGCWSWSLNPPAHSSKTPDLLPQPNIKSQCDSGSFCI